MKKIIPSIIIILLCVSGINCKKEDSQAQFSPPAWQVDDVGKYAASMTAVVKLPDELNEKLGKDDQLGAFVDDDCRGTGELISVGGSPVYFVMIHGTTSEEISVMFKYYCTKDAHMYVSENSLKFTIDGNYGTADNPVVLRLKAMK